jgi:hypothetical protein
MYATYCVMPRPRYYVGPAWPPAINAYDYVLGLCASDLAWEFLRRNPHYQRDYRLSRRGWHQPRRLSSGHQLTRIRRQTLRSITWGLHPFVDPPVPAPEASICWLASPAVPILEAFCDRPAAEVSPDVSLASLRPATSVIVGPAQEENVILSDSDNALTLRLHGSRVSVGPVGTIFLVGGIPDPSRLATHFTTLATLLRSPHSRTRRSRDRLLFRDALVALDGRRAGASHRDIAEVIFGTKRVREDWSSRGGWLKERMRRALAKGEELRDGGYRRALEAACRFSR